MKLPTLRTRRTSDEPGVTGSVRLDRRTKNLAKRLRPGDIAVIDHLDLDRASAEALVDARVAAVVNVAQSISGRYPNLGPELIAAAGIPLIDHVGETVFAALKDGDTVRIHDGSITRAGTEIGSGDVLDLDRVAALLTDAHAGLSAQLESFTANTMEYLRRERDLLLDGVGVPDLRTRFEGRHVLIVVRGYDYRADLRSLRGYIREFRPLLVGVDAGADALLEAGHTPDLILGDMDSVSDAALQSGAEVVIHAHPDGRTPGIERLGKLGVESVAFPATGTSEDIAMLLSDHSGAELIVAVGTHATLIEFLDKGRSGMASTFLTRLRVGPKLMDAKSVSKLYRNRIRTWQLLLLLLAGAIALLVAVAATPVGSEWFDTLGGRWDDLVDWFEGLFT